MSRWIATILVVLTTSGAFGQAPSQNLLSRTGWAKFHIILGRIEVANIASSQTRTVTSGVPGVDFESLTISAETDIPTVLYERGGISLSVVDGDRVSISGRWDGVDVVYTQVVAGTKLQVTSNGVPATYFARSLWHLLAAEREACRGSLLPILGALWPHWHLEDVLSEVAREIQSKDSWLSRDDVRMLVHQLGSSSFDRRRNADRELLRLGVGVLPILSSLRSEEWSVEQRHRVESVRALLRPVAADSPERISVWLAHDVSFREALTQ